jgi:hypothetical protein
LVHSQHARENTQEKLKAKPYLYSSVENREKVRDRVWRSAGLVGTISGLYLGGCGPPSDELHSGFFLV